MMTKSIVEFVKEKYPGNEHMLKWAIAMDNQPKDWSNFFMAIILLILVPLLVLVLRLKREGVL